MSSYSVIPSPIGKLYLACDDMAITRLCVTTHAEPPQEPGSIPPLLQEAVAQIQAYFAQKLTTFDLPINPAGTPFQQNVWQALRDIPYGETRSYKEIAQAIGNPRACRAVGMANHANPLLLLTPCHRVIGSRGQLTGFGAGLDCKQFLLDLEKQYKVNRLKK